MNEQKRLNLIPLVVIAVIALIVGGYFYCYKPYMELKGLVGVECEECESKGDVCVAPGADGELTEYTIEEVVSSGYYGAIREMIELQNECGEVPLVLTNEEGDVTDEFILINKDCIKIDEK